MTAADPQSDDDKKLKLLESSYDEVLDATKHQDDKIGRLLTVVAFLTAGTLALASLGQGQLLARRYDVSPFQLPLALISFVLFLMGVFVTVVLLLMALSHPLRIPGLAETPPRPPERRSVQVERASQLYFFNIAELSLAEWRSKWAYSHEELARRRADMLTREIHNLAGRTAFKYDRSREAVAIFTVTLLFFALTVVFQAFTALQASTNPAEALPVVWYEKAIVSVIVAVYIVLVIGGPNRASRQAMEEGIVAPWTRGRSSLRKRIWSERLYTVLLPVTVVNAMNFSPDRYDGKPWAAVSIVAATLSVIVFYGASWPDRTAKRKRGSRRKREWRSITVVAVATVMLVGLAVWSGCHRHYSGVLGAAIGAIGVITAAALAQPTLQMRHRRHRYIRPDPPPATDPRTVPDEVGSAGEAAADDSAPDEPRTCDH